LAALSAVVFFVVQIIVLVISTPPSTVTGYFELFYKNALLALLDLDLLSIVDYALFALLFLAPYAALRWANQGGIPILLLRLGSCTHHAGSDCDVCTGGHYEGLKG
jgi:hypothetical protein